MQMTGVGLPWEDICVPVGLDRFEVFRAGASDATGYVAREPIRADATGFRADVTLFDDQGVIAVFERTRVPSRLESRARWQGRCGLIPRLLLRRRVAGSPSAAAGTHPFGQSLARPERR